MRLIFTLTAVAVLGACDTQTREMFVSLGCPAGMVLVRTVEDKYDPIPEIDSSAVAEAFCISEALID